MIYSSIWLCQLLCVKCVLWCKFIHEFFSYARIYLLKWILILYFLICSHLFHPSFFFSSSSSFYSCSVAVHSISLLFIFFWIAGSAWFGYCTLNLLFIGVIMFFLSLLNWVHEYGIAIWLSQPAPAIRCIFGLYRCWCRLGCFCISAHRYDNHK